ncbi:hypothetical protein [Clostridium haemolyticum]|nr:hypothetical protein [Clostridium haemolyticum]
MKTEKLVTILIMLGLILLSIYYGFSKFFYLIEKAIAFAIVFF